MRHACKKWECETLPARRSAKTSSLLRHTESTLLPGATRPALSSGRSAHGDVHTHGAAAAADSAARRSAAVRALSRERSVAGRGGVPPLWRTALASACPVVTPSRNAGSGDGTCAFRTAAFAAPRMTGALEIGALEIGALETRTLDAVTLDGAAPSKSSRSSGSTGKCYRYSTVL